MLWLKIKLSLAIVVTATASILLPSGEITSIENEQPSRETSICYNKDKTEVENLILSYSCDYDIDPRLPYWIASCESGFQNVPNKDGPRFGMGIFQFVQTTFDSNCDGDVWNIKDNVACGVKLIAGGLTGHWAPYSGSCWIPLQNNPIP